MKSSAVFAFILAGAAATASAQPEPTEPSGRVSYTDQAVPVKPAAAQPATEVELASPTPASHGTEFIVVGKDAGQFSQLRFAATTGRVIVRRVRIFFEDGTQQVVDVDTILDSNRSKDATVTVKAGKTIDHITVATENGHGQYAIYGKADRANLTAQ